MIVFGFGIANAILLWSAVDLKYKSLTNKSKFQELAPVLVLRYYIKFQNPCV